MSTQPVPQPDQQMNIDVHPSMAHPLALPLDTPSAKAEELCGRVYDLWDRATSQVGQAASTLSTDLGGPELSRQGISDYAANTVTAAKHPFESIKSAGAATAHALGHPSDENLLAQAKAAYDQKDYLTAGRKFINYAIPFIGAGSDRSSESLLKGDYGAGISHALVAAMPLILGAGGEASVPMTEADAASQAAKSSVISERPAVRTQPVGINPSDIGIRGRVGGMPNVNENGLWGDLTSEHPPIDTTPKNTNISAATNVKPVEPLTPEARVAARVIREQYRNEESPVVEQVHEAPPLPDAANDSIREWLDKAYPNASKDIAAAKPEYVTPAGERSAGVEAAVGKTGRLSEADENELVKGFIGKLEKNASVSDVDALYILKRRLGLNAKPSTEAMQTVSKDTPEEIRAYAEGVKRANVGKTQGVPVPKVTTSPAPDGYAFKDAQIHTLKTSDGQRIGTMSTSPTDVSGESAVRDSNIAEKYQNQGHSLRMYSGAADNLRKQGFNVLRSDPISLSPEAQRTWESLSRTEPITKSVNPVNGEPVYRWDLTQKPGAKQLPVSKRFSPSEAAQNAAERLTQPRPSFIERTGRKVNQLMPHEEDVTSQIPTE